MATRRSGYAAGQTHASWYTSTVSNQERALGARCSIDSLLTKPAHSNRNQWLIAIAVLKLVKAVLFISMGFGVIRLLHKDLADTLLHITTALGFDPENRAVNVLLDKLSSLDPYHLKVISFALFMYAGLDVIEGYGLILGKIWAEYFTLILTASFLPWELYEIIRHVTILKVVLTLLNVFVVIYLAIVVKERVRERQELVTAATDLQKKTS